MPQRPEYQKHNPCPVCPTVDQRLETVRQCEATVADLLRRLGGIHDSDAFFCPFCGGYFARTPAASSSCNHSSPLGTQRRNTGDYTGPGSIFTPNSYQLDEALRTMSPGMRKYVTSLEEGYQQKMKAVGIDGNAASQNRVPTLEGRTTRSDS